MRVLVDGYSLLHAFPHLGEGFAPHSEGARNGLIRFLQRYQDSSGVPVSVFFDGQGPRNQRQPIFPSSEVEVLFSRSGQSADDLIERTAHRAAHYGTVLVVTDDSAERETVAGFGAATASCEHFLLMAGGTLLETNDLISRSNAAEQRRFAKSR